MKQIVSMNELMTQSGVKFGTSGARGLASHMTDRICYAYTTAFLHYLEQIGGTAGAQVVGIGGDLRPSTGRILSAVAKAVLDRGYGICNCGRLPSPALALYGIEKKVPTIMVTGSHIPEDRNGIKYTKADGEILKHDEAGIRSQQIAMPEALFDQNGMLVAGVDLNSPDGMAIRAYADRYANFFGPEALKGFKVGIYQHSAVGRDLLVSIFRSLGADTSSFGRADYFVPVDTEAIRKEEIELAAKWAADHEADAIVSTDGDSDRPLIGDENGNLFRGDVAGILCAKFLKAETVVTPVTSNSAVERCGFFNNVIRTRVGSPYVIEAMQAAVSKGAGPVCGYEANGGFLLATDVERDGRRLKALPTRDAIIVLITLLLMSRQCEDKVSNLLRMLPRRYTYSDRIKNFPTSISRAKLSEFDADNKKAMVAKAEAVFRHRFGDVEDVDHVDGCRIFFKSGNILHLRPSGNAPEFRCYTEAGTPQKAQTMALQAMEIMRSWIPHFDCGGLEKPECR